MSIKKKILISVVIGLVLGGVGAGASYLISQNTGMAFTDVSFYFGLGFLIVGVLAVMTGSPMTGFAANSGNAQAEISFNANVAMDDYKAVGGPKKFKENHVIKLTPMGIVLMLAGVINLLVSIVPVLLVR